MKKWTAWVALMLIISLLTACGDAGNYVRNQYPLVNVDGKGSNLQRVYLVEGKPVPVVATELAAQEPPTEKSKDSDDQMFLLYNDKVINIQKDPQESSNTLVEINTIEYAREHYDSSFLQGYLTATLLQSVFGGGWYSSHRDYDYRGYTRTPTYSAGSGSVTRQPAADTSQDTSKDKKPTTSNRTGTFKTGSGSTSKSGSSTDSSSSKSGVNTGSASSGSSSTSRKNDGSTPNKVTKPSTTKPSTSKPSTSKPSSSKPNTSSRTGSFKRR